MRRYSKELRERAWYSEKGYPFARLLRMNEAIIASVKRDDSREKCKFEEGFDSGIRNARADINRMMYIELEILDKKGELKC